MCENIKVANIELVNHNRSQRNALLFESNIQTHVPHQSTGSGCCLYVAYQDFKHHYLGRVPESTKEIWELLTTDKMMARYEV
jgi:arginyl-tRNA--protein-N-Asp/Glu arginylyltransferase